MQRSPPISSCQRDFVHMDTRQKGLCTSPRVMFRPMVILYEKQIKTHNTEFRAVIETASVMLSKYRENWMLRTKPFLLQLEKPVARYVVFQFSLSGVVRLDVFQVLS